MKREKRKGKRDKADCLMLFNVECLILNIKSLGTGDTVHACVKKRLSYLVNKVLIVSALICVSILNKFDQSVHVYIYYPHSFTHHHHHHHHHHHYSSITLYSSL